MKTRFLLSFLIFTCFYLTGISQVPKGFNYQAIARNSNGVVLVNQSLPVKIDIQTLITGGTILYEESFPSVTSNSYGLITLVVGTGTKTGGTAVSFSAIDWNQTLFLKTSIQYPGSDWTVMGTSQIWSTPYALVADKANGVNTGTKLSVTSANDAGTDALFEVKRHDGQTVFAVYPNAVNVYVPKSSFKGVKGGFSVGGYDGTKSGSPTTVQNYLTVSPDSVRIYIDPNPTGAKGVKGGFSVGGYDESKGFNSMYFNLTNYSTVNTVASSSQVLWYPSKNAFLAGNIHIGSVDSVGINSTALGYNSIAMGNYSQAFGFKTKALGDYSTAIGKNSVAGSRTSPVSNNAFAFGNGSQAIGDDSYALGSGSRASGFRSFAFGYASQATNTNTLALGNGSNATGINSTAIGYQSSANGELSLALGSYYSYSYTLLPYFAESKGGSGDEDTKGDFIIRLPVIKPLFRTITFNRANIANGKYSMSIGNGNLSNNGGMAIGSNNDATAFGAVAIGVSNKAVNTNTYSAGYNNLATGFYATAFGNNTYSKSYGSFVIGQYNEIAGDSTQWVSTDPVFVVGNGLNNADRSNAVTLYKNGRSIFEGEHANISLNDKRTWRFYIRGIGFVTTTSVYGVKSYVNRSDATVNYYYSGYFYNTGTSGTYMGLYADLINTDNINGTAMDVAEYYKDSNANTEPGDVVIADEKNKESVVKSAKAYQTSVLGVISTKPFIVMGTEILVDKKSSKTSDGGTATQLALNGRVPVNVSGENGPIVPGDILTTSSIPGHAMKWTLLDVNTAKDFDELKKILSENEKRRNAIIGKAVESFSGSGTGKIMVLISLQ
jgi:hypothetical protein